jgi:GNAT superfamily N-acetyltransferase
MTNEQRVVIKPILASSKNFIKAMEESDRQQNLFTPERIKFGYTAIHPGEKLKLILGAFYDNKFAGCAALKEKNKEIAKVARVFVLSDFRGQGIGKELMNAIINAGKDLGYKTLCLDTFRSNLASNELYKKCGFVEVPFGAKDSADIMNCPAEEREFLLKDWVCYEYKLI